MPDRPVPPPPRPSGRGEPSERERAALAELIEVERALASLEGRNVANAEHLVVIRQDAEDRRAALEKIIADSRAEAARRKKLLPYKIAGAVVAVGLAAAMARVIVRDLSAWLDERARAVDAAKAVAQPFSERFAPMKTVVGSTSFDFVAPKGQCIVVAAAGSRGGARVSVQRDSIAREADGTIGLCTCKDQEVEVKLTGPEPVAAIVLRAPAELVGGPDVLAVQSPRPTVVIGETVERACAEAAFDAWVSAKKAPSRAPEDGDQLRPEEQALIEQRVGLLAFGTSDLPFVVPPVANDTCVAAWSRHGDALSLRRPGGERVVSAKKGALGFCAKDPSVLSVWREGLGEISLFSAPRARLGGLLGFREAAARARVPITLWAPPEELADDARAALAASGIAIAVDTFNTTRGVVLGVSTDAKTTVTPGDVGTEVVCRPALDVGPLQSFCIEVRPGDFKPSGTLPIGVVRGPRPLWLPTPDIPDGDALERDLAVLAFARRMSADGFELTSLVGATLTADGADVTGRTREKEIVAIVVTSKPPYLHTLSPAGEPPWTLADPRPLPLTLGQVAKLKANPKYNGTPKREFVVWRR